MLAESKGRMLMLLKERSKVAYKPKARKRFKAYLPETQTQESRPSTVPSRPPAPEEQKKPSGIKKITPNVLSFGDTTMDEKK